MRLDSDAGEPTITSDTDTTALLGGDERRRDRLAQELPVDHELGADACLLGDVVAAERGRRPRAELLLLVIPRCQAPTSSRLGHRGVRRLEQRHPAARARNQTVRALAPAPASQPRVSARDLPVRGASFEQDLHEGSRGPEDEVDDFVRRLPAQRHVVHRKDRVPHEDLRPRQPPQHQPLPCSVTCPVFSAGPPGRREVITWCPASRDGRGGERRLQPAAEHRHESEGRNKLRTLGRCLAHDNLVGFSIGLKTGLSTTSALQLSCKKQLLLQFTVLVSRENVEPRLRVCNA
eukprot:755974-Hanusia_phi.AAC.2